MLSPISGAPALVTVQSLEDLYIKGDPESAVTGGCVEWLFHKPPRLSLRGYVHMRLEARVTELVL